VVTMPFATQTSVFFTSRSEATKFPMLVDRIGEPVDSWVISYSTMSNINQNDLKIFESRILIDPVGIENPKTTQLPPRTLLGNRPLAPLKLELGNSLVSGLPVYNTLGNRSLSSTSTYPHSVHNISLK